ncbi:MAG: hypothetical protein II945_02910, partial [Bacteroidales bacterium]|nr:hypothetical protein [Bacteroidales bacterium]
EFSLLVMAEHDGIALRLHLVTVALPSELVKLTERCFTSIVYLVSVAAENEEFVPKRAEGGLTGWIDCYGKSALKGHIFCGGVGGPNEIAGNAKLQEAYELGKQV